MAFRVFSSPRNLGGQVSMVKPNLLLFTIPMAEPQMEAGGSFMGNEVGVVGCTWLKS